MDRRNFMTFTAPRSRSSRGEEPLSHRQNGRSAGNPPAFLRRSSTGLEPYGGPFEYAQAAHLLRRTMVGPRDAEIRQAVRDGLDATVKKLLTPFQPDLTMIQSFAGQDVRLRPDTAEGLEAFQTELFGYRELLLRWWYRTIALSPVSIQERMTIFWHNHFTSELQVVNFPQWMHGQNQLLRADGLGNFRQFAKDVTKDMAMLIYLDNIKNSKRPGKNSINENYARELMELFTCGVSDWSGNPNYTQQDVGEAARALSGYQGTPISKGQPGTYAGLQSQWVQSFWDSGSKTIMGKSGNWKPEDVVDIILSERADQTAKFVCEKLYRAFIYDIADRIVVTEMAETFRTSNWEIRPVIDQLLRSAHFYDETNVGALQKSPVDYMIGMIRGMGITSVPDLEMTGSGRGSQDLRNRLSSIGMVLFDPPNVKGWPAGRTWVSTSTLPIRQKFAIDVANGALKARQNTIYMFDPVAFAKTFPDYDDIHKLSANMANFLLNIPPSARESESLYDALLDGGKDYEWDIDNPDQKAASRIRKFIVVAVQLAKFQLY